MRECAINMLKNIIFDMGNVLLDYDPEIPLNEFCRSEEEKDAIRRELFEGPEWVQGDMGTIRDADRYDLVKDILIRYKNLKRYLFKTHRRSKRVLPEGKSCRLWCLCALKCQ